MRALDLFSGAAGGWTLGLYRAGIATVAACEADPWRRAVYGARWPGVRLYDDVRTLTGDKVLADVGPIDLVAGSPPCQDASTANARGKGIDGERTGLFRDAVRLVSELRPRWVAFENVPGIRARGADWVLAALEAEGYTCRPLVVGAVHAGANHLRKRVWFVANAARIGRRPGSHVAFSEPAFGASPDPHGDALRHQSGRGGGADGTGAAEPRHDARDAHGEGLEIRQGLGGDARAEFPAAIRAIGEAWPGWNGGLAGLGDLDDGLPRGVARAALAAFGDAVVPQVTEAIGRSILAIDAMSQERAA